MINFMRYRWLYICISACVLIPGIYSLISFGLKPAIDFTGGTLLEFKINDSTKNINTAELSKYISDQKIEVNTLQSTGDNTFMLKTKNLDNPSKISLINKLNEQYQDVKEVSYESVGPTLGKELINKTIVACIVAIIAILSYVAYAFKNIRFGVTAVLALVHDLFVVLGIFSLLGKIYNIEIDSLFITAVLTAMSFSMHDTIVVFDRIREYKKRSIVGTFATQINMALTETVSRSLKNSLTIIFMLLALFLLGGETTKWFVLALLIGTISGTYSSPFVATPLVLWWHELRDKKEN